MKVGNRNVEITNEDKILFPKDKITKMDLVKYYQSVAKYILPLIKDRPISMMRYPNGIKKAGFFQKNISDYFPSWIQTKAVTREGKTHITMVVCNDVATLVYLANQAVLTPHIWLSKKGKLNNPDRLIFDLDPPKNRFATVIEAAKILREILEKELKLKTFVMTTGSKGLHIIVPIKPEWDFKRVRSFAKDVADLMKNRYPKKYTTQQRKNKRGNRIFIDYLRNGFAQTAVAPYAVRAYDGAPIAAPIKWTELKGKIHAQSFTMKNSKKRLASNPWKGIESSAKSLKVAEKKLKKLLSAKLI